MASPVDIDTSSKTEPFEYDWASFITAYTLGRWDPHKAPPLPRSYFGRQYQALSPVGSSPDVPPDPRIFSINLSQNASASQTLPSPGTAQGASSPRASDALTPSLRRDDTPPQTTSPPSSSATTPTPPTPGSSPLVWAPPASRRSSTSNITIPHRLRNSFADIRSSTGARPVIESPPASTAAPVVPHPDATTTAAAMRWAAARVNIAPLALPSPEHELTDPFRNARTAIPGSYPPDVVLGPLSPRHRQRLGSFWEGTIDVDGKAQPSSTLSSIQGSPPSTPPTADTSDAETDLPSASAMTASPPYATPATAPLRPMSEHGDDYFGRAALSSSPEALTALLNPPRPPQDLLRQTEHISPEPEAVQTAPGASRPVPVNFTRQTSSPFPNKATGPSVEVSPPTRALDVGAGRSLKEEAMFLELGYLAPPYPPDELERRRALYQFNIWNTGPDINFERIEHLTKLVFSTKTVIISLIDGNEQYVFALWGIHAITNWPLAGG